MSSNGKGYVTSQCSCVARAEVVTVVGEPKFGDGVERAMQVEKLSDDTWMDTKLAQAPALFCAEIVVPFIGLSKVIEIVLESG